MVLAVAYAFGQTISFNYVVPITFAIVVVLVIVAISYRQTVFAYPSGGGAYIVAKENLGTMPGLVAGAALSSITYLRFPFRFPPVSLRLPPRHKERA